MPAAIQKNGNRFIIRNPEPGDAITFKHFEPAYLSTFKTTKALENGRATVWFFNITDSVQAVLRHYYRGGQIARLSTDKFIWCGISRTRAVREYRLLEQMQSIDLPVPEPLGARVNRHGLFYTCDLITRQIPNTKTLAEILTSKPLNNEAWKKIGSTIKKLHQHYVWHSDLNANNILIDQAGEISLIDFDRCRIRHTPELPWGWLNWKKRNLDRLRKSLRKGSHNSTTGFFQENDWQLLIDGYKR